MAGGFKGKLFKYEPSLAAAIVFLVLYTLSSALHSYQLIRTKTWFWISFAIGGWFEVIGYAARIVAVQEYPYNTKPPYIINTLFPLVAPALFAASIYMALGRILRVTNGERYSLVRPNWLTKVFVFGDVASFILLGIGGSMVVTSFDDPDRAEKGESIAIAGLVVQIVFFSVFMVVSSLFNWRMLKSPTEKVLSKSDIPWQKHMNALYAASLLILIRSVFKLIEYIQGRDGYLFSKEWFAYVFDAALMFLTMVIFHFVHPSEINALLRGGRVVKRWVRVKSHDEPESSLREAYEQQMEA
ncbi:hypothetical protein ABW19_dt0208683 [Dactylella cylindrospora]|nr:hypothetical protein ABW19_dt0208683 [Dactylella cylindrospora]